MNTLLYISGCIAVIASVMVISRTNAVHALLYLIVSLLSVALIFFILGAPFVAALEVIIYAGAIMVLFIFAVMMLNVTKDAADQERQWLFLLVPLLTVVFLLGHQFALMYRKVVV